MKLQQHLRTTWKHIRRAPYQTLAAVGVMTMTFFILSVFVLAGFGSHVILRHFETIPQVTAFFKDEVTMGQVDILKAKLIESGEVKEVRYVSKEEALEIYREQNKDDPLLLEMVTANILPASLEVSTTDISQLREVADILRVEPGVEEVIFQQDVVKSLQNWTKIIRQAGSILGGALVLVSLLIILIVVGIKISSKKAAIGALSLIGAPTWYIHFPFLLEGFFYGAVGAILGWGIAYLLLLYATPFLNSFLAGISLLPVPIGFMFALLGGQILLGGLIGLVGGLLAVRRYFR